MADLATYLMALTGVAPTFVAAAASDTAEVGTGYDNFAVYRNSNAATRTVTVVGQGLLESGDAYPNKVYTLAALTGELWIPLIKKYDSGSGRATITTSAQAGVTVAIVRRR